MSRAPAGCTLYSVQPKTALSLALSLVTSLGGCALRHDPLADANARPRDVATDRSQGTDVQFTTERDDGPRPTPDEGPAPDDVVLVEPDVPVALTDVPVALIDVPVAPIDAPVDAPVSSVDVAIDRPTAPLDVSVIMPDVVSTTPDVVMPPRDAGAPPDARACGGAGQPCCAGRTCAGSTLVCANWGSGVDLCAPCGSVGSLCCAGATPCSEGSTCRSFYGDVARACVTSSTSTANRAGGPCLLTFGNCGVDGLLCVPERRSGISTYQNCLHCGERGETCCVGSRRCASGLSCREQPNGASLCL